MENKPFMILATEFLNRDKDDRMKFKDLFKKNNHQIKPLNPINPMDFLSKPEDDVSDDIRKNINNIVDMFTNPNNNGLNNPNEIEKNFHANLGTPDNIHCYSEDGVDYEKRTWFTPKGKIVKIFTLGESLIPNFNYLVKKKLTLEEKLENAVKGEDYEKAAIIRDLIKKELKEKKSNRRKK